MDVFSFTQRNPSLWGKLFSVIFLNVVAVKILSLKSGPLGFTMMLTERCEGGAGGSMNQGPRAQRGPGFPRRRSVLVGRPTFLGLGPQLVKWTRFPTSSSHIRDNCEDNENVLGDVLCDMRL